MKIYDRGIGSAGQADVSRAQETAPGGRADRQRSASEKAAGGPDTVQLSSAAGRVRQALDLNAASRAERVGELQAAYRAGAYVPDSRGTSRGMVREALAGGTA